MFSGLYDPAGNQPLVDKNNWVIETDQFYSYDYQQDRCDMLRKEFNKEMLKLAVAQLLNKERIEKIERTHADFYVPD